MGKTEIEWADAVWNPVTGCTKVSQGCKHCYAEVIAERFWAKQYPANADGSPRRFTDVRLHAERLEEPLRWRKPQRVFVNSMSDLFHEEIPLGFINRVMTVITETPQHVYMILTKRPERMYQVMSNFAPRNNLWLGVSVENQDTADKRVPVLLHTPAAVRFVSCEPLLGPVVMWKWLRDVVVYNGPGVEDDGVSRGLDWVIVGGESGHGARPMHPNWVRDLRDECQATGKAFFFKQWGEWSTVYLQGANLRYMGMTFQHHETFYRVGKKAAGRLLDGREWNEFPGGV